MVKIIGVAEGSLSERAGLLSGDVLLRINGNGISDVLDYRYYLTEQRVEITVSRGGAELCFSIEKEEYEDIGLEFETPLMDKKHSCKNGCIFCFIDQNPKGLRESLYFKDDDSRLSFLHGNYITLTNMTDADIERIIKMRFSPINVSVHTTNPALRVKMMKNKRSGEVLKYLSVLADAGIELAGQIVLCRGVNDGEELERTLRDLAGLYPSMSSVAVVPAGLTAYRNGLYPLADFTKDEALAAVFAVERMADEMERLHGERVFYAADELYLKAKLPIPDAEHYGDYPQIENGVGMLRSFEDEFYNALADAEDMTDYLSEKRVVSVATGVAAYPMISRLCRELCSQINNLEVKVYEIKNRFYGESITVSGLLTGTDLAAALSEQALGDELFIPATALRDGEDVFLCGMTREELEEHLSVKVTPCENDGYELVRALLGVP